MLSDKVLLQMTGTFAIQTSLLDTNELQVICELENGEYQKHFVYLNQLTTYTVEDISGSDVDKVQLRAELHAGVPAGREDHG